MLAILPESAARTRRPPGGIAWSFLVHGGIAMLVTVLSGLKPALDPVPVPIDPDTVIFLPMPSTPTTGAGGAGHAREPDSGPPAPMVPAPVVVPTDIVPPNPDAPPVEMNIGGADAEARRMIGAVGVRPGRRGAPGGTGHAGPSRAPDRVAAALPVNPRPRYPDVLRVARVEGRVTVDCVIDTSGTIDLSTVRIIESDHAHFTGAVHDVLPKLRFAPAEAGGRRVRQWVRIPFEFRLRSR